MAMLPTRRNSGRSMTLVNPSREFEDIYDRMGQLMNMAFGSLVPVAVPDLPWVHAMRNQALNFIKAVRGEAPAPAPG